MIAVLSDRALVKPSDAKTLDMKEEYWGLIEELVPVLQPLQIVTELLCAEKTPSASLVYPMIFKLVNVDLGTNADDSVTVRDFKQDLRKALDERFALSATDTPAHPFVAATVLDPATKGCTFFPDEFRTTAYDHVRVLVRQQQAAVADATPAADASRDDDDDTTSTGSPQPKRMKTDGSRSASLKFLASAPTTDDQRPSQPEFEKFLNAPEAADALQWWAANARVFPATAGVARQYLSVPATSAQSERQFSAAGRLISKLRSRLDTDRVDTIMFLYKNMHD